MPAGNRTDLTLAPAILGYLAGREPQGAGEICAGLGLGFHRVSSVRTRLRQLEAEGKTRHIEVPQAVSRKIRFLWLLAGE